MMRNLLLLALAIGSSCSVTGDGGDAGTLHDASAVSDIVIVDESASPVEALVRQVRRLSTNSTGGNSTGDQKACVGEWKKDNEAMYIFVAVGPGLIVLFLFIMTALFKRQSKFPKLQGCASKTMEIVTNKKFIKGFIALLFIMMVVLCGVARLQDPSEVNNCDAGTLTGSAPPSSTKSLLYLLYAFIIVVLLLAKEVVGNQISDCAGERFGGGGGEIEWALGAFDLIDTMMDYVKRLSPLTLAVAIIMLLVPIFNKAEGYKTQDGGTARQCHFRAFTLDDTCTAAAPIPEEPEGGQIFAALLFTLSGDVYVVTMMLTIRKLKRYMVRFFKTIENWKLVKTMFDMLGMGENPFEGAETRVEALARSAFPVSRCAAKPLPPLSDGRCFAPTLGRVRQKRIFGEGGKEGADAS